MAGHGDVPGQTGSRQLPADGACLLEFRTESPRYDRGGTRRGRASDRGDRGYESGRLCAIRVVTSRELERRRAEGVVLAGAAGRRTGGIQIFRRGFEPVLVGRED